MFQPGIVHNYIMPLPQWMWLLDNHNQNGNGKRQLPLTADHSLIELTIAFIKADLCSKHWKTWTLAFDM